MAIRFTAYLDGPRDMALPWPGGWAGWSRAQRQAWLDTERDAFVTSLARDALAVEVQAGGQDVDDEDLVSVAGEQELRMLLEAG